MKKIITLFLIFTFFLNSFCFSDDTDIDENIEDFNSFEVSSSTSKEPSINSKRAIVLDRKKLFVLYEKNAYEKVPMASTTKIMTCIIAIEKANLSDTTYISQNASKVSGSSLGLKAKTCITINDLLYGLMMRSGNDCAIAIAEYISGSVENFALLMNQKAIELGLKNTNFVTPHGLDDPNHYTTCYDLAILTDYALKNETFKKIVSTKNCIINFNNHSQNISNTNELLGNFEGIYGVKTGFTFDAGRCLVSACKRGDFDIITIVLGADTKKNRTLDSINLINYIYSNYKYVDISNVIYDSFSEFKKYFESHYYLEKTCTEPSITLKNLEDYNYPLSNKDIYFLYSKVFYINHLSPKLSHSKIGTFSIYIKEKPICSLDIILDSTLIKNSWKYYFVKSFDFKNILKK